MPTKGLGVGEVGYLITGVKDVRQSKVGDTVTNAAKPATVALDGYSDPKPMVFSGLYPIEGSDYPVLRDALDKLKLSDAALNYEPETSVALGFGFRVGFLGLLHLEIVRERLEREFNLELISTAPNVIYEVTMEDNTKIVVTNPSEFPGGKIKEVREPVVKATILTPSEFVGAVMELSQSKRGELQGMDYLSEERVELRYHLPLGEIVFDFFDQLKSKTRGYASLDYDTSGDQVADLVKVDILLQGEHVDAFSSIAHRDKAYSYGVMMTAKLKELIPRQQFEVPIQAAIGARVIARETIRAMRKDVLAKCYGGDISRKRKLLEKQKEGKKRMKNIGSVEVPKEAFIAALSSDSDGAEGQEEVGARSSLRHPGARRRRAARLGAPDVGRSSAVRRLRARPVLHGALRLLRLQHLHGVRAGRRREPGAVRDDGAAGGGPRGEGPVRRRSRARRGLHGLLRGRHARRCCPAEDLALDGCSGGDQATGLGPGRRAPR